MKTSNGLTKEQREEFEMHLAAGIAFDKFPIQVAAYLPIKDGVANHKLHIKAINDILPDKTKNTVVITEEKNAARLLIENNYKTITNLTQDYADSIQNATLASIMKFGHSQISSVADINLNVAVSNINKAITPIITDIEYLKYGVTATMITDGQTDSDAFHTSLGTNRQATHSVSVASSELEQLFLPLRADKAGFERKMEYFNPIGGIKPDKKFYDSIIESLILVKLPSSHTIFDGNCYFSEDENDIIAGVQIKNLTTGKLAITDLLGFFSMSKFKSGVFQFEISAAGYKTITVIIKIVLGKHLTRNFILEKLPIE